MAKNLFTEYNKRIMIEKMAEYTPKKINEMLDNYGVTSKRRRSIIHKVVPNQKKYLISESFTSVSALMTHADMIVPMMVRALSDMYMLDVIGVQPMSKSSGNAYGIFIRPAGRTAQITSSVNAEINKTNSAVLVADNRLDGDTDPLNELTEVTITSNTAPDGSGTAGASNGMKIASITTEGYKTLIKITDFNSHTLDELVNDINNPSVYVWITVGSTKYTFVTAFKDVELLTQSFSKYSGRKATAELEDPTDTANSITIELAKQPYEVKSRKLKAYYSQEAITDAMNDNGIDLREMGDEAMADILTKETDREIYNMMVEKATKVATFDFGTFGYHTQDNTKTLNLVGKINKESSRIAKTGRIGRGNFVVCTATVMSAIEQLDSFKPAETYTDTGEGFRGTLNGIRYYVNLDVDEDQEGMRVVVGVKGNAEHKAGLIMIPYQPITLKIGSGEDSGHEKVIMSSRYDLIENIYGAHNFYRTFEVKGLDFLG